MDMNPNTVQNAREYANIVSNEIASVINRHRRDEYIKISMEMNKLQAPTSQQKQQMKVEMFLPAAIAAVKNLEQYLVISDYDGNTGKQKLRKISKTDIGIINRATATILQQSFYQNRQFSNMVGGYVTVCTRIPSKTTPTGRVDLLVKKLHRKLLAIVIERGKMSERLTDVTNNVTKQLLLNDASLDIRAVLRQLDSLLREFRSTTKKG